jgi:hypothetical protein
MNHDDLAAGCQSFDGAKEVHRANERIPRTTGGRGGIRTLEAVLPPTRFPVARTRPGYATLPDWLSAIGHRPWISTRPHRLTDSPTPSRRRGWDSNPRWLITTPLFESGTFNHSDTSPTRQVYQRGLARRLRNGGGTAKPPGGYRAASRGYAWQDSNLRPLGPQPNALSPELQARIDHFTPDRQRPAAADDLGREGRDSNPRSAFSALNRLAGGPIRPLWHLPRWLCPRLAKGVACTGNQTGKFTTGPAPGRDSIGRHAGVRPHHELDPPPR